MSWKMTALVKEHFRGPAALKLLALILADYAADDGGSIFPSIGRLATETGLSERSVQRHMRELHETHGFLDLEGSGKGGTRLVNGERLGLTSRYRISVEWLKSLGVSVSPYPAGRVTDEPHRVTKMASKGDTAVSPEQSVETPEETTDKRPRRLARADRGVTFDKWATLCKQAGRQLVPEGDPVFAYTNRVGIDRELLELHWANFKRTYAGSDKRYIDWLAVFRLSVKGNWYRIWYIDRFGKFVRSTVGEQMRRDLAEPDGSSAEPPGEGNSNREFAVAGGHANSCQVA